MRPQQSETPALMDSRQAIRQYYLADEHKVVHEMIAGAQLSPAEREAISARAAELVRGVRQNARSTIREKFLAEYGLTTKEGVALMCLAEALLRVPDNTTIHELIEDKITSGAWGTHVGKASSSLINTATVALLEGVRQFADYGRFDGRRRRTDEFTEFLELGHDDLALDTELLGEFVDPDLSHFAPLRSGLRPDRR